MLLYGSESWVVTDAMMKVLEGFHHRIDRRITGKTARCVREEGWEWPPVEEALELAGMWPMQEYVRRRQATIEDCIATRLIYELCTGAEHMQGSSRILRWWEQDYSQEGAGNGASGGVEGEVD